MNEQYSPAFDEQDRILCAGLSELLGPSGDSAEHGPADDAWFAQSARYASLVAHRSVEFSLESLN